LSNQELVEEGTNDLLRKQLVEKIPISPILTQINDVLVNLVTCVNFLEFFFPKGRIVFQVLPPFTLWLYIVQRTCNAPFDVPFHSSVLNLLFYLGFEMKK